MINYYFAIYLDAGGILHARTPTHSQLDVKTGRGIVRGTRRSLYTLLHLCMSLFCLLWVLLFALGRVLT
jgi:hypothetical protein